MIDAMKSYPPVRVVVLGSGTSTGVPAIGCRCAVCTSPDPRNRRLRTSIMLEIDGRTFVVDCGVDFRQQMLAHPPRRLDAVLITHTHADHIHGLDDVRLFCFNQRQHIPLFTSPQYIEDIRLRFNYCFDPPQQGGGVPLLELKTVAPGEAVDVCGVPVLPLDLRHGILPVLGFRFGNFAYMTDCSFIPDETMALLEGVDTAILSALRYTEHPTHFNIEQALAASEKIGLKRAYFIHMTHDVDHARAEADLPDWARLCYDGLEFEVE